MPKSTERQPLTCYDQDAVIPSSATASGRVDLSGTTLCGLYMPSAFTGTSISFLTATSPDGTYVEVQDGLGNLVTKTVAAGKYIKLDPADFAGIRFLKLVSNATETAERSITLALRSV